MLNNKHEKGNEGEDEAEKYLIKQGFKVIERQFFCKCGELDIVAKKGDDIYFVEVKTRWSSNCGNPLESITEHKQKKIVMAAKYYLAKKRLLDINCHLSAIGIDMSDGTPSVEFIEDAFEAI